MPEHHERVREQIRGQRLLDGNRRGVELGGNRANAGRYMSIANGPSIDSDASSAANAHALPLRSAFAAGAPADGHGARQMRPWRGRLPMPHRRRRGAILWREERDEIVDVAAQDDAAAQRERVTDAANRWLASSSSNAVSFSASYAIRAMIPTPMPSST
jgi:hypothetical protein